MPICHYGGSGVLKNLVRRFYKFVIARPKAEAIQELNIQNTFVGCNVDKILKQVQDDINRHSEGAARRISFDKRSFANAQDDGKKRFFWFQSQNDRKKKAAFTLAEVLITLGIIGIVAAMTLPTVLSNVQDKVLESEAKKAANIVANGYKLMMAQDEIFNIKDMPMWQCEDSECASKVHREVFNIANDSESVLENLKNIKYYNSKNQEVPFSWERDPYYAFITTDGFAYGVLEPDNWDEVNSFDIIADVNANNNPNRVAKDLHKYRFSGEGGQLFDVTDELEEMQECSVSNPDGCKTIQQCESLPRPEEDAGCPCPEYIWYEGKCTLRCTCPA